MARVDFGVVRKAKKVLLDAMEKRFVISTGKIGAADAAAEECVAGENPAFNLGIEAYATLGMTWRADNLKGTLPHFDNVAVLQVVVRHVKTTFRRKSKPSSLLFGMGIVLFYL